MSDMIDTLSYAVLGMMEPHLVASATGSYAAALAQQAAMQRAAAEARLQETLRQCRAEAPDAATTIDGDFLDLTDQRQLTSP